jgi:glycerate 2-kinase
VVELSQASGLRLVPEKDRDPMRASTFGTGECIRAALARRPRMLVVAIGGSATVDGGMGLARALGVRFLDAAGTDVPEGGGSLERVVRVDASGLDPRFRALPVEVASDVLSPLLGPEGAARVYGPQKGASLEQVEALERGLASLAAVLRKNLDTDAPDRPGAGAAGGVGMMLVALGATLRSGAGLVIEVAGIADRLRDCDLAITGEGRLDASTEAGKAPIAVARAAAAAGVPCVALVGEATARPSEFADVRSLVEHFGSREEALGRALAGLKALAARVTSDHRTRRSRPTGGKPRV